MSLPTPFYDEGGITLFCGDCREILPLLSVEAIISDPPYGIALAPRYGAGLRKYPNGKRQEPRQKWQEIAGDNEPFDPSWLLQYREVLLWGAEHYAQKLPASGQWLIWDKRCGVVPPRDQGDCELAWLNRRGQTRIFRHLWDGMVKQSERGLQRYHPTQKPIELMKWCLSFIESETVCDPYVGSGTTLIAAKQLGRRAIGIEIDESCCVVAVDRLRQGVLPLQPARPAPIAEQKEMWR